MPKAKEVLVNESEEELDLMSVQKMFEVIQKRLDQIEKNGKQKIGILERIQYEFSTANKKIDEDINFNITPVKDTGSVIGSSTITKKTTITVFFKELFMEGSEDLYKSVISKKQIEKILSDKPDDKKSKRKNALEIKKAEANIIYKNLSDDQKAKLKNLRAELEKPKFDQEIDVSD